MVLQLEETAFEDVYTLRLLNEVSGFIIANKLLPEIPSAANMVKTDWI